MCGRFEQSETKRYYASALGADTSKHPKWLGDRTPSYNTGAGLCPWMIMLHKSELEFVGMRWGYRTPKEAIERKKLGYVRGLISRSQGTTFDICSGKEGLLSPAEAGMSGRCRAYRANKIITYGKIYVVESGQGSKSG